jgi:predicted aspartyl protease
MQPRSFLALAVIYSLTIHSVFAAEFGTRVVMKEKAEATFYVPTYIDGFGETELMVDTGAGYATINERTLQALERKGNASYVKELQGVLANGKELSVPVYAIAALNIGGNCRLRDVEVAVFPGDTRQILGLSALRKTAPFVFSVDPPTLVLSHCGTSSTTELELPAVSPLGAFD